MRDERARAERVEGDSIEIRGLEVLAYCGVLAEEQERRQPFRIDLDLWLDLGPAGASDDLDDTVNYGALIDDLVVLADETRFSLLEAMAEAVAAVALKRGLVDAVDVRVRKLRPPVAAAVDTTGVRIHRRRR